MRRVVITCCHCLRNLAYYKAGWHEDELIVKDYFWINVNSNFLDIFVLEWCKLFGDLNGKHYWRKTISDTKIFFEGVLHRLDTTEAKLESLIKNMRKYRDKFVAHLDLDTTMFIPDELTIAQRSVEYLYDYILTHENDEDFLKDAPINASIFYDQHFKTGKTEYKKRLTS